jgi:hypothetical protein
MSDNVLKFKQKVDVFPIAPDMIEDVLETVRPLLRKAQRIVDRDVGLGFIEDELREGASIMHPKRKTLKIELMGGTNMKDWIDEALAVLTIIAIDAECDAIEADGRKGFEKIAGGMKFKPFYTHYELELGNG